MALNNAESEYYWNKLNMVRINIDDALNLMHQGEREFKFLVELNIIAKSQMFITGKIHKGVESLWNWTGSKR